MIETKVLSYLLSRQYKLLDSKPGNRRGNDRTITSKALDKYWTLPAVQLDPFPTGTFPVQILPTHVEWNVKFQA